MDLVDITEPSAKRCCPSDYNPLQYTNCNLMENTTSPSSSSFYTTTGSLSDHPFHHPTDLLPFNYHNVLAAAPMVRISTLPFRLVCKTYGANALYSEELVAKKLSTCIRVTNTYEMLNPNIQDDSDVDGSITTHAPFVHFVEPRIHELIAQQKQTTMGEFLTSSETDLAKVNKDFRLFNHFNINSTLSTYPHERLVVQLGAGNAVDALNAATTVCQDAKAIDLNCGCPKNFSTHALFGSELLTRPEIIEDIVKTLKRNNINNLPVTIKIRMLPDPRHTVELLRRVEHAGVDAVAVHCRFKPDRPRWQALPLLQMPLLSSIARVPLIYNGDIYSYHEIDHYRHITRGCWCPEDAPCVCGSEPINSKGPGGVMIGRGAIFNPTVFGHYLSPNGAQVYRLSNTSANSSTQLLNAWCPLQNLLQKLPFFSSFLTQHPTHTALYDSYLNTFTNPLLTAQQLQEYPNNYQTQFYTTQHAKHTQLPQKPTNLDHYTVSTITDIHDPSLEDNHDMFTDATHPYVYNEETKVYELYIPPVRAPYEDLIQEIDTFLINRDKKAIDTNAAQNDVVITDNLASSCMQNTSINDTGVPTGELGGCDSNSNDDYIDAVFRSKPQQNNDPRLNPLQLWLFGRSYLTSSLLPQNQRVYSAQKHMLPSFYPTALLVLLSATVHFALPNVKYIVSSMIKHHPQITKDPGFRLCTGAKSHADLLTALDALRCAPFRDVFYHPQPINKHEPRPTADPAEMFAIASKRAEKKQPKVVADTEGER